MVRIAIWVVAIVASETHGAVAQTPVQHWIEANTHAIAQIGDPKKRAAQRRLLFATRVMLAREERRRLSVAPPHDPKRLAHTILSNARHYRFTQPSLGVARPWWERALDWLDAQWSRLLRMVFGRARLPAHVNTAAADALLAITVVAFLALLFRLAWLYGRATRSKVKPLPLAPPVDPLALYERSVEAARRGNYTLAVSQLFAAAVAALAAGKRLDDRRSTTVGEMSRRVRASDPRLGEPFGELSQTLSDAVYAERALSREDWARSLGAFQHLEALLK